MSTLSPTLYAERVVTVLEDSDGNTARAALLIASALLEHRINRECAAALQVAEHEEVQTSVTLPPEPSKLDAALPQQSF
jgi:hypothetical protein